MKARDRSERPRFPLDYRYTTARSTLRESIESVLVQDFTDFELFISDNASTDATWEISQEYATLDDRVRVHKQVRTLPIVENFRFVLENTNAPYFMWHAHDDVLRSDCVKACYAFLEKSHPDYVLAYSPNITIDESGRTIQFFNEEKFDLDSDNVLDRIQSLLSHLTPMWPIYGLFWRKALEKAPFGKGAGRADQIIVVHVCSIGKIGRLEAPMRYYRVKEPVSNRLYLVNNQRRYLTENSRLRFFWAVRGYIDLVSVCLARDLSLVQQFRLLGYAAIFSQTPAWRHALEDFKRAVQFACKNHPQVYDLIYRLWKRAPKLIGMEITIVPVIPYLLLVTFPTGAMNDFNERKVALIDSSPYHGVAVPLIGGYEVRKVTYQDFQASVAKISGQSRKHVWPWVFFNRFIGHGKKARAHSISGTAAANPYFQAIKGIDICDFAGALGDFFAIWRTALVAARNLGAPGIVVDPEAYNDYRMYDLQDLAKESGIPPDELRDKLKEIGTRLSEETDQLYPEAIVWFLWSGLGNPLSSRVFSQKSDYRTVTYIFLGMLERARATHSKVKLVSGGGMSLGACPKFARGSRKEDRIAR